MQWKTDEKGEIIVRPLAVWATAKVTRNGKVLLALDSYSSEAMFERERPERVQLILNPDQAEALGRALLRAIEPAGPAHIGGIQ